MRTAAVGVAVALLATACGGGDGGEEVADAADAATETTATEVTTTEVATTETTAVPEPTATPEMAEGGAIEITAAIVFGESAGSFQISEGSDVLGCAMGTFEEAPLAATIERTFTCDMGERAGSFVLHFFPEPTADPTEFASDWTVEDATGDFAGLTGEGGFAALVDEDESGAAETWTGEVTFGAPSEEESDALAFDGVIDVAYLDAVLETQRIDDGVGTVQLSVFGDDGGVTTAVAGTDEAGSSPTGSTPYRVGSITKVFTSIATLSLVADGSITLDDPASDHITRVDVPTDATVRDLLRHTSGIPDITEVDGFFDELAAERSRRWTPEEMVAAVADLEPTPVGGETAYSNTNYTLLGILVEEVTGRPFQEVLRERVIEPAGLVDTHLAGLEDGPEPLLGFTRRDAGPPTLIDFDYTSIETAAWASGGLVSTGDDLHRLFTALHDGDVIPLELVDQMVPEDGAYGFGLFGYGDDDSVVGHDGGIDGTISLVFHIPATGQTVFGAAGSDALLPFPAVDEVVEALVPELADDES
ncbi:MAG: serine hydrolase domain-containing protein [Actinomycetota bacterium]